MATLKMEIADSETCLALTLRALSLGERDADFLEKAIRAYGELRINEYAEVQQQARGEAGKFMRGACRDPR